LFAAALEMTDEKARQAFLEQECAGDAELRQHLEVLLRTHDQPQRALAEPLATVMSAEHHQADSSDAVPAGTAEEQPGTVLAGKYKLIERIGEGGMGSVWMAQQSEPVKRTVAVKLIKDAANSKAVLARFDAERQALALMDHPNIARVLDAGTTDSPLSLLGRGVGGEGQGRPFFVMELVKGVPITKFCDAHKLTPRQRLELFVPVCQAVQHAHQKGIIHRDIKPSNVLVASYDDRPVPKVIDFGLAKATGSQLTERTLVTGFGALVGTPQYMSPEQATLNNLDIDTRSDVYSLGVLLYEMLAGSPPFRQRELEKAGVLEVLRVIREVEPPRPSTRLSTAEGLPSLAANRSTEPRRLTRLLRGDIDWIVMKALEKERSRRYETANGFATDIQRYLADEPVLAGPPSAAYRLKKFVKRNKGRVMAVAFVLLALIAGMAGTTMGFVRADRARRDAEEAQQAEAKRAEGERLATLDAEKRLKQIEQGTEVLSSVFDDLDPSSEEKTGESLRVLLGKRLGAAVKQLEGEAVGDPVIVARLQSRLGSSLLALGHFEQAEAVLTRARTTLEASRGAHDLDTLTVKRHLATVYYWQTKYAQAETLYKEVLEGRTARLGADHLDTISSKHGLAAMYLEQGKYRQAQELFKEVLESRIRKLGADHPDTLETKNEVGRVYQEQGLYPQAEALYKEVLNHRAAKLGADHADTLESKHNLALLRYREGKYVEAETRWKEMLPVLTNKLGADHPKTLMAQNSLALTYADEGKYPQAELLYKEVFQRQTAKLGADGRQTLVTKNNLALLYLAQGNYARADTLFNEVLVSRMAKLGTDHPETLSTRHNLALVYADQQRYPEAEKLHKQMLAVAMVKLGSDHPWTLLGKNSLALLYEKWGRYPLAEKLFNETLRQQTATLGADNLDTLTTKNNLALLYRAQRKYRQAETLFKEVLERRIAKLGADHPETFKSKHNLALVYANQGRFREAETLHKEMLAAAVIKLGADHPLTLQGKEDLAGLYEYQRKYPQAEILFKEVLDGRIGKFGADHPLVLRSKDQLAFLYRAMKKWDRSIALLEEVAEQTKKSRGAEHPSTVLAAANLGIVYRDAGRHDDAIRRLEEAASTLRKLPRPVRVQLVMIPAALASLYDGARQYTKSEPLYRELLQQSHEQVGADDRRTAGLMAQFGLNLLAQKKHADAEPVLRDCLAIRDKEQPDDWVTFNTRSMLGEALVGQKKYAEAEPLLRGGYKGLKVRQETIPEPVRKLRLTEALQRLVQLYDAWDKKDEADRWRKEVEKAKTPSQPGTNSIDRKQG
jgi:serine/threonine protein kinase/tetratricopeptide (TPR) repeat protein